MKPFFNISLMLLFSQLMISQGEFYSVNHGSVVMLKDAVTKTAEKHLYVNENWMPMDIYLKGNKDKIEHAGKLDIFNNTVDVSLLNELFSLPASRIDSLVLTSISKSGSMSTLKVINSTLLNENERSGFLVLLYKGEVGLFKRFEVKLRKANYKTALNLGTKEDKYSVKDLYYIYENGQLTELPSKKKKFYKSISKYKGAERFAKSNKIKSSDEEGLITLFNYINKNKS